MVSRGEAATLLLVCLIVSGPAKSQPKKSADPAPRSVQVQVVPDLQQRVARFRQVEMPFRFEGLSAREKGMVLKLVEACRYLEDIYWRQVDPGALSLYNSLEGSNNPQDVTLRRFLWINYACGFVVTLLLIAYAMGL